VKFTTGSIIIASLLSIVGGPLVAAGAAELATASLSTPPEPAERLQADAPEPAGLPDLGALEPAEQADSGGGDTICCNAWPSSDSGGCHWPSDTGCGPGSKAIVCRYGVGSSLGGGWPAVEETLYCLPG
jgi:hypothetical protein